jgi:hypothetical protein
MFTHVHDEIAEPVGLYGDTADQLLMFDVDFSFLDNVRYHRGRNEGHANRKDECTDESCCCVLETQKCLRESEWSVDDFDVCVRVVSFLA